MPTPFSDIYDLFLSKVSDYDLVELDDDSLNSLLKTYLLSSVSKFVSCKQDLSDRDDDALVFNITLTDLEKEILATYMVYQWIYPKVFNIILVKQIFSTKDFNIYSQANHLKELLKMKSNIELEVNRLIMNYSYHGEDLDELT